MATDFEQSSVFTTFYGWRYSVGGWKKSTILLILYAGQFIFNTRIRQVHLGPRTSVLRRRSDRRKPGCNSSPALRRSSNRRSSLLIDTTLLINDWKVHSSLQRNWLYSCVATVTVSLSFSSSFSPRLTFAYLCWLFSLYMVLLPRRKHKHNINYKLLSCYSVHATKPTYTII